MKTEIIWEDDFLLVCYKPAGMPAQTAKIGEPDCVSELKNYGVPYIALINRLDQPVEGIMLVGKTDAAAKIVSEQIAKGEMKKYYYAVVQGKPEAESARLTDYLIKNGKTNQSAIVDAKRAGAKKAELSYETVAIHADTTLLRIQLKTGRHHQIRVQMAHAGHPLLGDVKYGAVQGKGIALAAYSLEFSHPKTKKMMKFQSKPRGLSFVPYIGNF